MLVLVESPCVTETVTVNRTCSALLSPCWSQTLGILPNLLGSQILVLPHYLGSQILVLPNHLGSQMLVLVESLWVTDTGSAESLWVTNTGSAESLWVTDAGSSRITLDHRYWICRVSVNRTCFDMPSRSGSQILRVLPSHCGSQIPSSSVENLKHNTT